MWKVDPLMWKVTRWPRLVNACSWEADPLMWKVTRMFGSQHGCGQSTAQRIGSPMFGTEPMQNIEDQICC